MPKLEFEKHDVAFETSADLRKLLQSDGSASLLHELVARKLLVFREQTLTANEQVQLTKFLGEPQIAWDDRNRDETHPEIQVIENTYKGGSYHYCRQRLMSTVRYWHADTSFLRNFTRFTVLRCVKAPDLFGETNFVNTHLAFCGLPSDLRKFAQEAMVEHSFDFVFGELLRVRNDEREEQIPNVVHPLLMADEFEQKCLYLSELSMKSIVGLSREDSDKYLTKICEFAKQRVFRYNHVWREGDVVIWDNIGTMHRGDFADPDYPRTLHRTTVARGFEAKIGNAGGFDFGFRTVGSC